MYPPGAGTGIYPQIFRLCRAAGFVPRIGQTAGEASTIIGLVAAGSGITLLPASFDRIRMDGVCYRPICSTARRRRCCCWRSAAASSAAGRRVRGAGDRRRQAKAGGQTGDVRAVIPARHAGVRPLRSCGRLSSDAVDSGVVGVELGAGVILQLGKQRLHRRARADLLDHRAVLAVRRRCARPSRPGAAPASCAISSAQPAS